MKDGIFFFGDVYFELKEQFYNVIFDCWVEENLILVYFIIYIEVLNDFKLCLILDDDFCVSCVFFVYCFGENFVCCKVVGEYDVDWFVEFDEDGYVIECDQFIDIVDGGINWVFFEGECV